MKVAHDQVYSDLHLRLIFNYIQILVNDQTQPYSQHSSPRCN
jgi:hypothetical protein